MHSATRLCTEISDRDRNGEEKKKKVVVVGGGGEMNQQIRISGYAQHTSYADNLL